jgi:hypothetical protein
MQSGSQSPPETAPAMQATQQPIRFFAEWDPNSAPQVAPSGDPEAVAPPVEPDAKFEVPPGTVVEASKSSVFQNWAANRWTAFCEYCRRHPGRLVFATLFIIVTVIAVPLIVATLGKAGLAGHESAASSTTTGADPTPSPTQTSSSGSSQPTPSNTEPLSDPKVRTHHLTRPRSVVDDDSEGLTLFAGEPSSGMRCSQFSRQQLGWA